MSWNEAWYIAWELRLVHLYGVAIALYAVLVASDRRRR